MKKPPFAQHSSGTSSRLEASSFSRRQFLATAAASATAWTLAACGNTGSVSLGGSGGGGGGQISGLDFPGSTAVSSTMRFRFLNPLPIYPATYIWQAYPRQQNGYYTAFFWGNDGTFQWNNGSSDTYYGAHPYPSPPPNGSDHNWEISVEAIDPVNGAVVYNQWYTQALRVWADGSGKHHEYFWDLPNTDAAHMVSYLASTAYGNTNPPTPALTWGDAPWNPGNEVWNGILRGIQVYTTALSVSEILNEADTPRSTSAGSTNLWYLNLNPTPNDISDQSGNGNHPEWVGSERPTLWTG